MDQTPPLLRFDNLQVQRGGKPILRGVNAEVPRGRITALVGLNGSGKSTLLRTLVGEFSYRGKIVFRCGHDHSRPRPEYVGYVPQRLTIDTRLPITVRDLLALALKRWPVFFGVGRQLTNKIEKLLARVGVADLLEVPVDGLSGGQLQRVLLALALEPHPELLLLDEPAAGIDFQTQHAFYEMISQLNREEKATILLVSHDLEVVRRFADHVLCLHEGVIRQQGTAGEVLHSEALTETFGPIVRHLAV